MGIPCSRTCCPIAEAANELLYLTLVGGAMIKIFDEAGDKKEKELPLKAQKFVRDFDNHEPVKPFSFTLRVPDRFVK